MMKNIIRITQITIAAILVLGTLSLFQTAAEAAYKVSFESPNIEITSPGMNNQSIEGVLTVKGLSGLDKVWLCVRGPAGEINTYPAEVKEGHFTADIWLRFGEGTYTVWAGEDASRFDGSIRFEVQNATQKDNRYLTPSAYVDSNNPEIIKLVNSVVKQGMDDMQKLQAIHDWVAGNISYDYKAYLAGENNLNSASQIIKERTGICRDYAFVTAAMARAAGLPTRVVYGQADGNGQWESQLHAWNEVMVSGNWVSLDTTWDAGYVKDNSFVAAPSKKYFAPKAEIFAMTHAATSYTVH